MATTEPDARAALIDSRPQHSLEMAAHLLDISQSTLARRIRDGSIRTKLDAGRTYVTSAEIRRYIAKRAL